MIEQIQKEKIEKFIDEKEKKTLMWQLNENLEELWLDVKIGEWLKNDEMLLSYAQMYLNESKSIFDSFKMQFIELKAKIQCPYFEDFKVFLNELKQWENTKNQNESSEFIDDAHQFLGTKVSDIESQPYYKNPEKGGTTRCSATAQFNWLDFWLTLPKWNAYDAWAIVPSISAYIDTIPNWNQAEKPKATRPSISVDDFNLSDNSNFADIYTSSNSNYGHRAVAFKDWTWQWYVLDPYTRVNGNLDDKPKKLEDYMSQRKIVKSNFYTSAWYNPKEINYA